jgi:hypothetical protein
MTGATVAGGMGKPPSPAPLTTRPGGWANWRAARTCCWPSASWASWWCIIPAAAEFILDLLLAVSIISAVLILMTSLFIEEPLEFSSFPPCC